MKYLALFALVALAAAGPARKEEKPAEEKKPADDKPILEEKARLQWPMPDPSSEGDLMLHGSISYDRVRDLHKGKSEDDVDKMILAHGRLFLRRVLKFWEENGDFKIEKTICRDSRTLNSTINRWSIEIPKPVQDAQPAAESKEGEKTVQRDAPLPKEDQEKAEDQPLKNNASLANETETTTTEKPTDKPTDKPTEKPSEKPTEQPLSTTVKPEIPEKDKDFEVRRREFYRESGVNFARLLMREYRKEKLVEEETEYLARWLNDEAVHYGAMAIYCNEGENVKEIKKQLTVFVEEKAQ